MTTQELYLEKIQQELKQTPVEYLPNLLKIIHSARGTGFATPSLTFKPIAARGTGFATPSLTFKKPIDYQNDEVYL